jgi:hypothetical protein
LLRVRAMATNSKGGADAFVDRMLGPMHGKASRWHACMLSGVLAGGASCGGRLNGAEEPREAGPENPSVLGAEESGEAGVASAGPLLNSPVPLGPEQLEDAAATSNTGVLCGYHTGPLAPGQDAGGPVMRCNPGWICMMLNAGWACCTPQAPGSSGGTFCNQIFPGTISR